jgi:hypothetical protein
MPPPLPDQSDAEILQILPDLKEAKGLLDELGGA